MTTTKYAVRRSVLASRRALTPEQLADAAERLADALAPLLADAAPVASYRPLPGEPRPPVVDGALLPVLLPDGDLDWERDGVRLGVGAVADAALVLVPAVAVDRAGVRLGRGGGSYDRALARTSAGWVVTPSLGLVGLPREHT
jgi:5-formyltetrahydrofolate cyclo-ligase